MGLKAGLKGNLSGTESYQHGSREREGNGILAETERDDVEDGIRSTDQLGPLASLLSNVAWLCRTVGFLLDKPYG